MRLRALVAVGVAAALAGCAAPVATGPPLGVIRSLEADAPGFVLEASPVVEGEGLALELRVQFAPADLVYLRHEDGFEAPVALAFRVLDGRGAAAAEGALADTLRAAAFEATASTEPVGRAERLAVPPGTYVAEAVLRGGGEPVVRRVRVRIAEREGLTPIRLRQRDPRAGLAHAAWDESDPLVAEVDAPAGGTSVAFRVLRLRSDTTVAQPPHWVGPQRGALAWRGVDPSRADTVAEYRRVLSPEGTAGVALPPLRPGVYRVEAEAGGENRSRLLAVMPEGHPALPSVDALVEALAYVTYPREYEALRRPAPREERRRRFDAFWGEVLGDRRLAEATVRRYAARVEMANRLFSGFKPGWMTDRGMLYVVLGPPEFVERTPEGERWYYAYGVGDPARTFVFERAAGYGLDPDVEPLVLVRAARYEGEWERAIRRWRAGQAR